MSSDCTVLYDDSAYKSVSKVIDWNSFVPSPSVAQHGGGPGRQPTSLLTTKDNTQTHTHTHKNIETDDKMTDEWQRMTHSCLTTSTIYEDRIPDEINCLCWPSTQGNSSSQLQLFKTYFHTWSRTFLDRWWAYRGIFPDRNISDCSWRHSSSFSTNRQATPDDSYSWTDLTEDFCKQM